MSGTTSTGSYFMSDMIDPGMQEHVLRYYSTVQAETPNTKMKIEKQNGVNPAIYFSYVKSKLSKIEKQRLSKKLEKLRAMVYQSEMLKQDALYEELTKMMAITVRELEIQSCGIETFVMREYIEKYRSKVNDAKISLVKLDEFPRVIPTDVAKKIKDVQAKNLFDNLWILYTEKPHDTKVETNEKKIARKDPILFGSFAYNEDVFYHIASWVDEYCDLTLDKFVGALQKNDPDFKLPKLSDDFDMEKIKAEVMKRHERLANTNRKSWERDVKTEQVERKKRWYDFVKRKKK